MPTPELADLRTRCAEAYSEWRACASDGSWSEDGDAQCRLLKRELDSAAQALFIARRPNLLTGGEQVVLMATSAERRLTFGRFRQVEA